jgi:ADP-ribosylglycohydrolase
MAEWTDSVAGVILGTAAGDALGLPREGLSPQRARRLFGGPPLRYRLLFGLGMASDDTEHTCMTGQALLRSPDDVACFARALAWKLRWWLLGLPAGIGKATLKATLKLWLGWGPSRSGVFSAGNGPAMRSALLGVCLGDDPAKLRDYVRASTRLTHTDPKAERGALVIALAAHHGSRRGPEGVSAGELFPRVREAIPDLDDELAQRLGRAVEFLGKGAPAAALVESMGLRRGVTGYMYHTVPVALYCWLRSPGDFRRAVEEVIELGGDADTTGAIVGALCGATVGASGIPEEWLRRLIEWPRTVGWMRRLSERLARQFGPAPAREKPLGLFWPGLLVRNLGFLVVVLLHGFRRLLPPY